jgi:hypothetical protein
MSATAPHEPQASPFYGVFGSDAGLPEPFRRQFLLGAEDGQDALLEGEMTRVWLRHGWMKPIFWILGRLGILVGQTGERVPATLRIRAGRDSSGLPYHAYNRTLRFPSPARFNTRMVYFPDADRAAELFGPGLRLYMVWDASFQPPDTLTMTTHSFGIRLPGWNLTLPRRLARWLAGWADFTQTARGEGRTRIELAIRHPLPGDIFGYEGEFEVRRAPASP